MPIGINLSNIKLPTRAMAVDPFRGAAAAAATGTVPTAPAAASPGLPIPFDVAIPGVADLPTIPVATRPPIPTTGQPVPSVKTATQLARGAVQQLIAGGPDRILQAVNAIVSVGLDGPGLMTHLERKTRIRVVLDAFAQQWDQNTRADFADAFRMPVDQTDAMDAIVALAIINDRDLEQEIIAENTADVSTGDLTDNRNIVWQYPPAGTVLQPPYIILVAVDYRDVLSAQDIYKSIADQLANYTRGTLTLRVPKDVVQRLG